MKNFIEKLADNLTKGFSINSIYNTLRSIGLTMDKNLLYDLMIYVENIYLAFRMERYDYSLASRRRSDKKVYFIDNGLVNIISHQFGQNKGKLLENAIFIFLRRNMSNIYENNIFYHKDKTECDFVVFNNNKATHCIQVAYDVSDIKTKEREIKGLLDAMDKYNLQTGYIITAEQEEDIITDQKAIMIRPAYKILLDNMLS